MLGKEDAFNCHYWTPRITVPDKDIFQFLINLYYSKSEAIMHEEVTLSSKSDEHFDEEGTRYAS